MSLALLGATPAVLAQTEESRGLDWEGSILFGFLGGNEFHFEKSGLDVGLGRLTVFGFEGGAKLNDYLTANFIVFVGKATFYRLENSSITMSSFPSGLFINAEFQAMKFNVSPVVSAGVGFLEFKNASTEYFISMFQNAFCLTFRWGIGLRLTLPSRFFIKVLYESYRTKYPDTSGPLVINGIMLRFGRG